MKPLLQSSDGRVPTLGLLIRMDRSFSGANTKMFSPSLSLQRPHNCPDCFDGWKRSRLLICPLGMYCVLGRKDMSRTILKNPKHINFISNYLGWTHCGDVRGTIWPYELKSNHGAFDVILKYSLVNFVIFLISLCTVTSWLELFLMSYNQRRNRQNRGRESDDVFDLHSNELRLWSLCLRSNPCSITYEYVWVWPAT